MKYDAIIFDMDGVLLDATNWHYEALNEALEPFGYSIPIDLHLDKFNGLSTKSKLEILSSEYGLPRELHSLISETKQDRTQRIAYQKCFPNPSHLILLNRLKILGFRIGLCTNSIRLTTEQMLGLAQLINFMDVVVTNEDVRKPKPDPEGYLLACEQLSVSPHRTLVVEDGKYGIEAARKAGCDVIEVEGPHQVTIENLGTRIVELIAND
jgi:HAD superfamily hydrolase (TIGR01509 family)